MGCCENPASKKPKGENKVNSLFSVLSPDRKALDLVSYRCQKKPPRLPGGVTKGHTKSKIHDSKHSRFIPLKASKPVLLETQGISFCRGDQSCNRAWQKTLSQPIVTEKEHKTFWLFSSGRSVQLGFPFLTLLPEENAENRSYVVTMP